MPQLDIYYYCFRMAHEEGDPAEIAKLTGLSKYFNTLTTKGRVNVSANLNYFY